MINLLYNESNISFIKNKRKKESLGHTAIFRKYHFQNWNQTDPLSGRASGKLLLVQPCCNHSPLVLKFQSVNAAEIHMHPVPSYESLATRRAHVTPLLGGGPPHGALQPTAACGELRALPPFHWGGKPKFREPKTLPSALGLVRDRAGTWTATRLIPKSTPLAMLWRGLYSKTFLGHLFICPFHKYLLSIHYAHDTIFIHKGDSEEIWDNCIPQQLIMQPSCPKGERVQPGGVTGSSFGQRSEYTTTSIIAVFCLIIFHFCF